MSVDDAVTLYGREWIAKHGSPYSNIDLRMFEQNVETALRDAIAPEDEIDFAEPIGDAASGYPTVLLLRGRRLFVFEAVEDAKFATDYLGELPGGRYREEVTIDEEVAEREITYEHPRLPSGRVTFSVPYNRRAAERFASLRALFREWSTPVGGD
jgi:hypothetical protein